MTNETFHRLSNWWKNTIKNKEKSAVPPHMIVKVGQFFRKLKKEKESFKKLQNVNSNDKS